MAWTLLQGVYAKDVVLKIIGDLRSYGVTYESVKFVGNGFARFTAENFAPMVAQPYMVDNVCTVQETSAVKINVAYIGSCTNARLSDLKAAYILAGKHIVKGVRLIVCPASTKVLKEAMKQGIIDALLDAGASLSTSGCSICVGTLGGVPADGEVVISATNLKSRAVWAITRHLYIWHLTPRQLHLL